MKTGNTQPWGEASRVSITSDTSNIAGVRTVVIETAERIGFIEPDLSSIAVAIDEAICNVIKHGYAGQAGQPIDVILQPVRYKGGVGLEVKICDRAPHVDPARISGRDLEDVRPGGLGTHIINTVMDEVEYSQRKPEGMQLRLLKMIDGASKASAPETTPSEATASNTQPAARSTESTTQENPAND